MEFASLVNAGYSDEQIIKMMKFQRKVRPHNLLAKYRLRLNRYLIRVKADLGDATLRIGKHCGKVPTIADGEIVCQSCGQVLGQVPRGYTALDMEGRQPINRLIWNNNLGGDDKKLVIALRKAGILQKLNSSDLKVDDEFSKQVKLLLAQKARARGMSYDDTDRLARLAMRKVRVHVSQENAERIAEETWKEFEARNVK